MNDDWKQDISENEPVRNQVMLMIWHCVAGLIEYSALIIVIFGFFTLFVAEYLYLTILPPDAYLILLVVCYLVQMLLLFAFQYRYGCQAWHDWKKGRLAEEAAVIVRIAPGLGTSGFPWRKLIKKYDDPKNKLMFFEVTARMASGKLVRFRLITSDFKDMIKPGGRKNPFGDTRFQIHYLSCSKVILEISPCE